MPLITKFVHTQTGFEAPRNSLDVLDAAIDVSRSGSFKPEDIPVSIVDCSGFENVRNVKELIRTARMC